MAILIKRYANRKLYNTDTSRYITLKGIAKLLEEGEEVHVIDKETGDDITQVALSQILVDNQRSREDPSDTLLTQILSKGGDVLYGAIKKSVDDATEGIGDFQDRFRQIVNVPENMAWPRTGAEDEDEAMEHDTRDEAGVDEPGGRSSRRRSPFERPHPSEAGGTPRSGRRDESGALPEELKTLIDGAVREAVQKAMGQVDLPDRNALRSLDRKLDRVNRTLERIEEAFADGED